MEQGQINAMIEQKRVKLDFSQALTHYFLTWFILLIPAFTLYDHIRSYLIPTYVIDPDRDLTQVSVFLVVISILNYFIQRKKLKFSQYKMNLTQEDFEQAVRRTALVEKWTITTLNKQVIQAIHRPDIWMGAGELITIINQGNMVLINSISNPNERGGSFFGRQNRRNIASLLDNLRDVANQLPEKNADPEIPEKEWTLKKVLSRLVLYPVCISLIIIGIDLIIEVGYKATIPAIGCISVAAIYLYSDIKIITKRTTSTSEW